MVIFKVLPRYVKMNTLSIMPATVSANVSSQCRPKATPLNGPAMNFSILAAITLKYFAHCINSPVSVFQVQIPAWVAFQNSMF